MIDNDSSPKYPYLKYLKYQTRKYPRPNYAASQNAWNQNNRSPKYLKPKHPKLQKTKNKLAIPIE